jgi:hypothetical protein
MGILFNGTGSQYLEWNKGAGTMPMTGVACYMLAFIANNGSTGSQQCIMASLKSDGSANLFASVDGSGGSVQATHGSSTASGVASGISSSAYKVVVAEYPTNSLQRIYFNSATFVATDPGSNANDIGTHDRICIGGYHYTGSILSYSGSIAEVHFFQGALTTSEITSLIAGSIKPEQMTNWVDGWQLKTNTDLVSMSGTRTLTAVGSPTTSGVTHPISRSSPVSISSQPSNQTVTVGSTATFSVTAANGTAPYTYQWQRNPLGSGAFANISGATSSSYTTPAATITGGSANNTDTYLCIVTDNTAATATSNAAILTVVAAIAFTGTVPTKTGTISTAFSWVAPALSTYFSGGIGSYTYSLFSGTLQAGLTLNSSTGVISGTPSASGTATLVIRATDTVAGTANTNSFNLVVGTGIGTITTPTLRNNTGTILANETGATVNVYDTSSGALVVSKTSQTSNSVGIMTITDALITSAATYAYEVILSGGRRRLPTAVAASTTITTPVLKNNGGTVRASETGVIANVYDNSTGALVVHKTGLTSDITGVVTITDVSIVNGTTYAYEIVLATNGRRLPTAVAA